MVVYEENKYDYENFPKEELLEACEDVRDNYIGAGIFTFLLELLLFVGTLLSFILLMNDGFDMALIASLLVSLFVLSCLLCVAHDMYIYLYKFKYVYPKMIVENPKTFIKEFLEPLYISNKFHKSGYTVIVEKTKKIINEEIVDVIGEYKEYESNN